MMLAVGLALATLAAPPSTTPPAAAPAPPGRVKLIVLEPVGESVDAATIATIASLVSVELARDTRYDVLSAGDVKRMTQFSAEKQDVGCTDDGCLAELAGALGANLIVYGDVGKLGDVLVVNLNVFDAKKARAESRVSIQVTDPGELPARIPAATKQLIAPVSSALFGGAAAPVPFNLPWTAGMIGAGVVLVGFGVAFDALSETSSNGELDIGDFCGPVFVAAGVGAAALGLFVPVAP